MGRHWKQLTEEDKKLIIFMRKEGRKILDIVKISGRGRSTVVRVLREAREAE